MTQRHAGKVRLAHSFAEAHSWLELNGPRALVTRAGTLFEANGATAIRGRHKGEAVVRFLQGGEVYGTAYACCWEHRSNCSGTWIGMYCRALDGMVGR